MEFNFFLLVEWGAMLVYTDGTFLYWRYIILDILYYVLYILSLAPPTNSLV